MINKYNIGDYVYLMHENKVVEARIKSCIQEDINTPGSITQLSSIRFNNIIYSLYYIMRNNKVNVIGTAREEQMFKTKEELIKTL